MKVVVVGAGWAGLSAAVRLCAGGHEVTLLDAAHRAGGRARALQVDWGGAAPIELDNGQHLMIGAYAELLALLAFVGEPSGAAGHLSRAPMQLLSTQGLSLRSADLTGVLRAGGLGWRSRFALLRVLAGLRTGARNRIAAARGRTCEDWWRDAAQPAELVEAVWRPLVLSALNTDPREACAATFLRVLNDSVAGPPGASDFLLPDASLGAVFVEPVMRWLLAHGVRWLPGCPITRITREAAGPYRLHRHRAAQADAPPIDTGAIVLATPPLVAARLLDGLAPAAVVRSELRRFDYRPISTIYAGWRASPADPAFASTLARFDRLPVATLLHEVTAKGWRGQWFFRRPAPAGWCIGAVVISDSRDALARPAADLVAAIGAQIGAQLALPTPHSTMVVHEKRATIACTPGRPRLDHGIEALPGVVLAGDYQYADYPATLEGALRSGRGAAASLAARAPHQIAPIA